MPKGRPKKHQQQPESSASVAELDPIVKTDERDHASRTEVQEPVYTRPKSPKWDLQDPRIAKKDKHTIWSAVFKCTNPNPIDPQTGQPCSPHKTKATNKTPASDVPCHKCGWPTEMVDIFKHPPTDYRAMRVREPDGGDFEGAHDA